MSHFEKRHIKMFHFKMRFIKMRQKPTTDSDSEPRPLNLKTQSCFSLFYFCLSCKAIGQLLLLLQQVLRQHCNKVVSKLETRNNARRGPTI